MTLNEMRRLRIEMGISYKEMAEKAGIPLGTLQKVFGGVTQNPRRETLRKIEEALLKEWRISPAGTRMVREKPTPYYVGSAAKASDDADKLPHVYPRQGTGYFMIWLRRRIPTRLSEGVCMPSCWPFGTAAEGRVFR